MKRFFTIFLLVLFQIGKSQSIIWSDDFSDPSKWVATQEYGTTLFVIGKNGPSGQFSSTMGKIRSSSSFNNFALYDADPYIGSLGKRAHLKIATPINLSAYPNVVLEFEQYFRGMNTEKTSVQISTNGITWDSIMVNSGNNGPTPNPEIVRIDISTLAGGKPTVWIRFTYNGVAAYAWMIDDVKIKTNLSNDASVKAIYTLGKIPKSNVNSYQIAAVIRNEGSNNINNLNVTLSSSGVNNYTSSILIPSLPSKTQDTIYFSNFIPSTTGYNNITVSIPQDNDNTNNSLSIQQQITDNIFNYSYNNNSNGGTGLNGHAGMLLVKHTTNEPLIISKIKAFITGAQSIGKTIYAVVLDSSANVIAQSNPYTIQNNDLNAYKTFEMTSFPIINNTNFYVGIYLPVGNPNFAPIGYQNEIPVRTKTFYKYINSTLEETIECGRPMIETEISDTTSDIGCTNITYPTSQCILSNNEIIQVQIKNFGYRTIPANTEINLNAIINPGNIMISNNITLTNQLLPQQTTLVSFSTPVDFSLTNTNYSVKVYTRFFQDNKAYNDTFTTVISTKEIPQNIELGNDRHICGNSNTTLTVPYNSNYTYTWKKGNQTLSETSNSLTITPSMGTGVYSVIVTNQYNCSASDNVSIFFNEIPTAELGARDTSVCPNEFFTLSVGSFQGCNYKWFETSNPANILSQSTSLYINKSGTYVVVIEDTICNNFATDTMSVNLPVLELGEDIVSCGTSYTLNAGNFPGFFYQWKRVNSQVVLSTTQTLTVTTSGTYFVSIFNVNCPAKRDTITVTFTTNPTINLGNDITLCDENSYILSGPILNGFSYTWINMSTGDTISHERMVEITESATYQLNVSTKGGCFASDQIVVSFYTTPTVDLGTDTIILYGNEEILLVAPEGYNYTWYHGNEQLPNNNDTLVVSLAIGDGWYYVFVNNNGCIASDSVFVQFITKTNLISNTNDNIIIYPLPTSNYLTIESTQNIEKITITDITGKSLINKFPNQKHIQLNVEFFPKGTYFIIIETTNNKYFKKLIITK